MRRQATMSQKVGLAGNIDVPMRQASTSSALSDDAIPTSDPNDVSCNPALKIMDEAEADRGVTDLFPFG